MTGRDWVTVTEHWCLTEDRSRVVRETDPEARFLHWSPGTVVSREEAERLGAVKREPAPEPEQKKAAPAVNKARLPGHNKGR
ncbi:hypothetical protein [Streptomyces sp. NRRL S-920]|uniref:hypothetical protein n=1 Tax=Streptomyces sp. NRRL S-920 TaxID=1463921 RepID=UPI0004CAB715|nr:hypothetical protein [Streptomyces sp. NRRL S-920]